MSIRWRIIRFVKDVTLGASRLVGATVARFFLSCCTVFVILWVAVLMYVSFYYAYMPTVSHVRPVFLLFDSECENARLKSLCSFPEANLSLSTGERILMRGQRYQVFLDLEMPHSPVNEKLGMFMVKVTFLSDSGKVLASSERSVSGELDHFWAAPKTIKLKGTTIKHLHVCLNWDKKDSTLVHYGRSDDQSRPYMKGMLHYQSALLQSLATVFYSVPMLLGFAEEKQIVRINLFEEYVEDSYHPAVGANVIVLSKQIEIYSAALRIEAHFVGLRYIMINWPATSALLAITFNFFIISTVFFFAYSAFSPDPGYELYEEDAQPAADLDTVTEEQQRALAVRSARREGPGEENIDSSTRLRSSGRLRPRKPHTPRKQANGISNGGLTRCASFPSCRWDKGVPQGALASAEHQASCSLHRHGPCYHSNDNLAGSQCCPCLGGTGGGDSESGRNPTGLQDHRPSTEAKIDTEPYYVLNFHGGKMWRSRRNPYADGHVGTRAEDGCGITRHGTDGDGYLVRRHTFSGLRSRYAWKKVPERGNLSSSSSMECVHSRMNRPRKRVKPFSFNKSYDSDDECQHDAYGRDCDHGCHHECMECGSDLTLDGPLNSRVPDGAASSSEHLNNWAPGALSTQDSGPISSEQSTSRPLSETDHTVSSNKRSVNKTRARFGLSFKKILSKKDEKSP